MTNPNTGHGHLPPEGTLISKGPNWNENEEENKVNIVGILQSFLEEEENK